VSPSDTRNLRIFTAVSSIWAVVMGFIGPFYVVQVERLSGGMEKMGIAFGIMVLVQSVTTYGTGRFSDRLGRKPFLFLTAYMDSAVLFLYTVIGQTYQLYLLQAALGVTNGIVGTVSTSLLGDLTKRESRGKHVGTFNAVVSLASAAGLFMGGYLVKIYGLKSLFYLASGTVALSTLLLYFIREDSSSRLSSG
jgi:MFS transporter, DHA1 family, multidrug resistance protein